MCVLIVCDKATPEQDLLRYAAVDNPDGAGYAFLRKGQVHYFRGVGKKAVRKVLRFAKRPEFPCLIHFRFATVGGERPELAHPFPLPLTKSLSGTAPVVIAQNGHNGAWAEWVLRYVIRTKRVPPRGEWSDTRALGWLLQESSPADWDKWLSSVSTSWGKVAVFTPEGIKRYGKPWIEGAGYVSSVPLQKPLPRAPNSAWEDWDRGWAGRVIRYPAFVDTDETAIARTCDVCGQVDYSPRFAEGLWLCEYCYTFLARGGVSHATDSPKQKSH